MKISYFIFVLLFILTGCATSPKNIAEQTIDVSTLPQSKTISVEDEKQEINLQNEKKADSTQEDDFYKVAIIFPSKVVGKYAKDSINTVMAYMLHNNIKFQFEVFDSLTQDNQNIIEVFKEVKNKEFTNVIALFTQDSLETLFAINDIDDLNLYLPLVNKNEVENSPLNIVYGGIDYKKQIQTLETLSNQKNSIFYSNSRLGLKLKEYVEQLEQPISVSTMIDENKNVFKKIVKKRGLQNSSLFLNTSIIKSSIILSQLRVYGTVPYKILSTQLNYTPLVISLTQYPDRRRFIVANSISKTDLKLQESLFLLDSDIEYNWVNYATLIGIDSLYTKNESTLFPSKIIENQVDYDVKLYKNTRHGFKKLQ